MSDSQWHDAQVELLRRLWSEGLTGQQIANQLGDGITRSAVIGKIHRLGLRDSDRQPAINRGPLSSPLVEAITVQDCAKVEQDVDRRASQETEDIALCGMAETLAKTHVAKSLAEDRQNEDPVQALTGGVGILDLRDHHCRWPLGPMAQRPPYQYCGMPRKGDLSYCAEHAAIAFPNKRYREEMDRRFASSRAIKAEMCGAR